MPLSYGDRFGPGASTKRPEQSGTSSVGRMIRGTIAGGNLRPGNSFQRANTMKELLNMGFPTELAARAVEASAGDLQKAVDWVLEHKTSNNAPVTQRSNLLQPAPHRDLLDFGAPATTPQFYAAAARPAAAAVAPKSMATEVLAPHSGLSAAAVQPSFDEDFADFGAFESALPAATSNIPAKPVIVSSIPVAAPSIPVTAPKGPLSNSIGSLYSKGPSVTNRTVFCTPPKQKPTPGKKPLHGMSGLSLSSPDRKSLSPVSKSFTPTSPSAIPKFSWRAEVKVAPKRSSAPHVVSAATPAINATSAVNVPAAPMPPPPPLPVEEPWSDMIPPPPSCPPPTDDEVSGADAVVIPQHNDTADEKDRMETVNSPKSEKNIESNRTSAKVDEAEEDPFAALSMFALSSAKSQKKTPDKPILTTQQLTGAESIPTVVPSVVPTGAGDFDLDALLG